MDPGQILDNLPPLDVLQKLFSPLTQLLGGNSKGDKQTLTMLDNVSGVLKPGRLTLLLGPPGAGKSTLLRLLSGQLKDKEIKVSMGSKHTIQQMVFGASRLCS